MAKAPRVVLHDRLDRQFAIDALPGQHISTVLNATHIPCDAVIVRRGGEIITESSMIGEGDDIVVTMVRAYHLPDLLQAVGLWPSTVATPEPSDVVYVKRVLWFDHAGRASVHTQALTRATFPEFLEQSFVTAVRHARLLDDGDRVGLALSGGRDSLALLHLLERTRKQLPAVDLHVITVCGLDAEHDEDIAADASAVFDVQHHLVHARVLSDMFGLKRSPSETLAAIYGRYGEERCINCSHVFMRTTVERRAAELGIKKIAFGLHNEDLIASVLRTLVNGLSFGESAFKKTWGPFEFIYPLWATSKKELTIYLELIAPLAYSSQGSPGNYDRGGANRDMQYLLADHLQNLWPGFSYHALDGYGRLARHLPPPIFGRCRNCDAIHVTDDASSSVLCAQCSMLRELDLLDDKRVASLSNETLIP